MSGELANATSAGTATPMPGMSAYEEGESRNALDDWQTFVRRSRAAPQLRGCPFGGDALLETIDRLSIRTLLRGAPGPLRTAMVVAIVLAVLKRHLGAAAIVIAGPGAKDRTYQAILAAESGVAGTHGPLWPGDTMALAQAEQRLAGSVLRRLHVAEGEAGYREANRILADELRLLLVVNEGGEWSGPKPDFLLEVVEPRCRLPRRKTLVDLRPSTTSGDETAVVLRVSSTTGSAYGRIDPFDIQLVFENSRCRFRHADDPDAETTGRG